MSERGVFAVDRRVFDHPIFAPEPYTEREAWLWMVGAAAWKPMRVRVGHATIELARGQLAFATRFLATKWRWSEARVRRFLKRLKIDAMVYVTTTRDATQITICNYERYAFGGRTDDAQTDAPNDALATHERRKEEELKNSKKGDGGDGPIVTDQSMALADELAVIAGHDLTFIPPSWFGAARRVQTWLQQGWKPEIIRDAVKAAAAKKRDGPANSVAYFEQAVARAHALQAKPLPEVVVSNAEVVHVTANRPNTGNVIPAIDRLVSNLAKLNEPAPDFPELPRQFDRTRELRSGTGTPPVRAISQG